MKKICIIGLGNMGGPILEALRRKKKFEVSGFGRAGDKDNFLKQADIVIIAVKPQDFSSLADAVKIQMPDKLIISIMAGIDLTNLKEKLGAKKVVCTIPNLPLKIRLSLTPWIASEEVGSEDKLLVKEILKSFGEEIEVDKEEMIGVIGAMSGCGPAYFSYIVEKIEEFALKEGLSKDEARKVAEQTFVGSAQLLKESGWSALELRQRVSSKGGTTEAAFKFLESKNFGEIFMQGIQIAIDKSKELNK